MPTLIDWSHLQTKINATQALYSCKNETEALTYIILESSLGLNIEDIRDSITDGGNDRGIDAAFIDDREGKNVVHLFQVKYTSKFESAGHNFPSNEIDKILSFVGEVLAKDTSLRDTCNPILWGKVQEIWDAFDREVIPSFVVHLCGNMEGLTAPECKRFSNALAPYKNFDIEQHTLESVVAKIIESRTPQIDRQIRLVDKQYFERVDGNIRGLICTITALELVKLIQDPNDPSRVLSSIFEDNVRVYLTSKNRINARITQSALSEQSAEFWYLNNGITITCDSFGYAPGTRAPLVSLKNVQIVNGGQTSNALFEAFLKDQDKLEDVLILARIYETKYREISQKIAESTNSQTPIRSRDLRSNDEVQKKLEEEFLNHGYYYERKTNMYKEQPSDKRIDALSAGQAYLAYSLDLPEVAKKDRGRIFGDLYDQIFNDDITAKKLLTPVKVFAQIEARKIALQLAIRSSSKFDPAMLFLIDGSYHVLYTISVLCTARVIDDTDPSLAIGQIDDAIEIVQEAVRQGEADPAFSFNRFFKDAKTKRRIAQIAEDHAHSSRMFSSKD